MRVVKLTGGLFIVVMAGLVPAIHDFFVAQDVDGRDSACGRPGMTSFDC
jgi:hypothetical protein